jgi:radical SAM protein with 4Fe4S-binding SPASM domain
MIAPPDHLYIELSDECNLHCRHCYLSAGPAGRNALAPDVARTAACDFARMGGISVTFSGGEPLLYARWKEVLAEAASAGLSCAVVTNGTLLTAEAIDFLLEYRVTAAISLDGDRAAEHDLIRGRGSFQKTWRALEEYASRGAQDAVTVCFTPMRPNAARIASLASLLQSRGFPRLYTSFLEQRGRERQNARSIGCDDNDLVRVFSELALLMTAPDTGIVIDTGHLKHFFARLLGDLEWSADPIEGTMRIAPTGKVYLSAYVDDEKFCLGSVPARDVRSCWFSERTGQLIAQSRARRMPACAECPYFYTCRGGSPTRAFAATGTFDKPDDFCHAKARFLEAWFAAQTPDHVVPTKGERYA